jgi:hypothetical protein
MNNEIIYYSDNNEDCFINNDIDQTDKVSIQDNWLKLSLLFEYNNNNIL